MINKIMIKWLKQDTVINKMIEIFTEYENVYYGTRIET